MFSQLGATTHYTLEFGSIFDGAAFFAVHLSVRYQLPTVHWIILLYHLKESTKTQIRSSPVADRIAPVDTGQKETCEGADKIF